MRSDNYLSIRTMPLNIFLAHPYTDHLRLDSLTPMKIGQIIDLLQRYNNCSSEEWCNRVILTGWTPSRRLTAIDAQNDLDFQCIDEIGEYYDVIKKSKTGLSVKYQQTDDPPATTCKALYWQTIIQRRDLIKHTAGACISISGHGYGSLGNIGLDRVIAK